MGNFRSPGNFLVLSNVKMSSVLIALVLLCLSLSLTAVDVTPPAPAAPAEQVKEQVKDAPVAKPTIAHFGVELTVDKTAISIGDTVTATVTYRWPTSAVVVSADGEPDPARDFVLAFVTDLPPPEKFSSGQEERRVFRITVAAPQNGAWELPRPTLTIRNGADTSSIAAAAVIIQVGLESAPAQLPPARPAWTRSQAPSENSTAWWMVAVVLIITLGIVLLLWTRRRTPTKQQTPWELFTDDWQAAAAAADGKEVGARLSLGLRRCLGTVFRFDGPASTAKETLTFLRRRLQDAEHRELTRLLEQLDAFRWAADDLAPSAVRPLLENGRAWVRSLQQRLDAEAEAAQLAKQDKSSAKQNDSTSNPSASAP